MSVSLARFPAPPYCCPGCWHRHGRMIGSDCPDHTPELCAELRAKEQIKPKPKEWAEIKTCFE